MTHDLDTERLLLAAVLRLPFDNLAPHLETLTPDHFTDPDLGACFPVVFEAKRENPHLGVYVLQTRLAPNHQALIEEALNAFDRYERRDGPLTLPDIHALAQLLHTHRVQRLAHLQTASALQALAAGDTDTCVDQFRELLGLFYEPPPATDPYQDHLPDALEAERSRALEGKGFAIHPQIDALLRERKDWAGEIILLGAQSKSGKTRMLLWIIAQMLRSELERNPASEHQWVIYNSEMTRASLLHILERSLGDQHAALATSTTPSGRPRLLWRAKDNYFTTVARTTSYTPAARLAAIHRDLTIWARANCATATASGLPVADCHFAAVAFDYATSLFSDSVDFSTCTRFARQMDLHLRAFDPDFYLIPSPHREAYRGLPTMVITLEQVTMRSEATRHKVSEGLQPPHCSHINGPRAQYEGATAFFMLGRDFEGRHFPSSHAVLGLSGRACKEHVFALRFGDDGVFTLQATPLDRPTAPTNPGNTRLLRLNDACYVARPPAVQNTPGDPRMSSAAFLSLPRLF